LNNYYIPFDYLMEKFMPKIMSYPEAVSGFQYAMMDFKSAAAEVIARDKGIVHTVTFDPNTSLASVAIRHGETPLHITVKCTQDDLVARRIREGSAVVIHQEHDGLGVVQFAALPPTRRGSLSTVPQADLLAAYSTHPQGKGLSDIEIIPVERVSPAYMNETTLSGAAVIHSKKDHGYLIGTESVHPTDTVFFNAQSGGARIYSLVQPKSSSPSNMQPFHKKPAVAGLKFT
jgi:hypothetical protein